ncbi:MAG: gamma-glutamyl-gamma-aminobutyrate hydrolase family protein [Anaerofustis stercorihominis]|nr:gamma-glutamyl-gamma-aminobutyrate hydrolase family protein [Anaerofustis stercorihominis]
MKKPLIGISPILDNENDPYQMLPNYMRSIEHAGGAVFMLPITEDEDEIVSLVSVLDGILLTGGVDVSPTLYGEEIMPYCEKLVDLRDRSETALMKEAVKQNKPVMGICRGMQFLNVFFGGTLYQDIPTLCPSDIRHRVLDPKERAAHTVTAIEGTPLFDMVENKTFNVNSRHHQGVKKLAPCFKAMATSEEGLVEAIYMPENPNIFAVQWHPEYFYMDDPVSQALFRALVNASKNK